MEMTPAEICSEYRQSAQKQKQIQILAELNACSKKEIVKILSDAGEQLPGNYIKKPNVIEPLEIVCELPKEET